MTDLTPPRWMCLLVLLAGVRCSGRAVNSSGSESVSEAAPIQAAAVGAALAEFYRRCPSQFVCERDSRRYVTGYRSADPGFPQEAHYRYGEDGRLDAVVISRGSERLRTLRYAYTEQSNGVLVAIEEWVESDGTASVRIKRFYASSGARLLRLERDNCADSTIDYRERFEYDDGDRLVRREGSDFVENYHPPCPSPYQCEPTDVTHRSFAAPAPGCRERTHAYDEVQSARPQQQLPN